MATSKLKLGDWVTYKKPIPDEKGIKFRIVEIDVASDWAKIRANVSMRIQPEEVANLSDLKKARK